MENQKEKVTILPNGCEMISFKSSDRFREQFMKSEDYYGNVFLKFSASWCNPCKTLQKNLEAIDLNRWNIKLIHVDIEKCPMVADDFEVSSIPVFILFQNGEQVYRQRGLNNVNLTQLFDKYFGQPEPENMFFDSTPNMFLNMDM